LLLPLRGQWRRQLMWLGALQLLWGLLLLLLLLDLPLLLC
jgi:hypothetical protein